MRWLLPVVFAASLLALFLPMEFSGKTKNALDIGGFVGVVASLLLMSFATIDQLSEAWSKRRPVFWFYVAPDPVLETEGSEGLKALTVFSNRSRAPIKMYVDLKPTIYGRNANAASLGPKYTGNEFVLLGPENQMNGNFSVSRLLAENGEDVAQMRASCTPDNRTKQLRLSIRISCRDKSGKVYTEPDAIPYYFDFGRGSSGVWVYDG